MAVLVTAIHAFPKKKAWMRGTSPRMTTWFDIIAPSFMLPRLRL
jgi:hypothetical protein